MTILATDGHAIGSRGLKTRTAMIDAAKELLDLYPLHNVLIKNIVDMVGCSPAAFWQYFAHMDDLIEAMTEDAELHENKDKLWAKQVISAYDTIVESRKRIAAIDSVA